MPMGGMELLILLVIILLFFGARRVPELARSFGRGKREFQRGIEEAEAKAEEEREKAEARQDKEESPPPEGGHPEEPTSEKGEDARAERSHNA
jgi:sec-independent protein translocase protein TatA